MLDSLMHSSLVCIAIRAMSFAKGPIEWKQGKLLNLDIRSQSRIIGDDDEIMTVVKLVCTYTLDGGDRIHDGQENGHKTAKPIHVEVDAPVQYAVNKDHLYIKDLDGKLHKLDLIRTTRKEYVGSLVASALGR